jgi:hypothetical protein
MRRDLGDTLDLTTPMFVYPDHNFLIGCIKNSEWRDLVMQSQRGGSMSIVLSPWHFYEYGNARNHPDTADLVSFAEELNPLWIMERTDLQQFEYWVVWNQLWQSSRDEVAPIASFTNTIAVLVKLGIQPVQNLKLGDFVTGFSQDDSLELTRAALKEQQKVAASNRQAYMVGRFNKSLDHEMNLTHLAIQQAKLELPGHRPDEVFAKANQLLQAQPIATQFEWFIRWGFMPKLKSHMVERALTHELYATEGKLDANRFVDRQHATIALPYTNILVTSDKELLRRCGRIKSGLPFPIARLMTGDEFISYLSKSRS